MRRKTAFALVLLVLGASLVVAEPALDIGHTGTTANGDNAAGPHTDADWKGTDAETSAAQDGSTEQSTASNWDRPNLTTTLNRSQFEETVSALQASQQHSRWHTSLRDNTSSLYATHHFTNIYDALDDRPSNANQTASVLRDGLESAFTTSNLDGLSREETIYLRDYYNAVESLDTLGFEPNNVEDIVERVKKFRAETGAYCFSRARAGYCKQSDGSLVATRYAVSIYESLGRSDAVTNDTKGWVQSRWNAHRNSTFDFHESAIIVRTVQIIGEDPTALPGYRHWRTNASDAMKKLATAQSPPTGMDLKAMYYVLVSTDIDPTEVPGNLHEQLRSAQLPDGGYNIVGQNFSDPHGTAAFVRTASITEVGIATGEIRSFVTRYELPNGGYAAVYDESPSVDKTFFAQKALSRFDIDRTMPASPTTHLTKLIKDSEPRTFQWIYWIVYGSGELETRVRDKLHQRLTTYFDRGNYTVRELDYAARLAMMTRYPITEKQSQQIQSFLDDRRSDKGGYGDPRTIPETYHAVSTLSRLSLSIHNRSETVEWIKQSRTDDGGFAVYHDGERVAPANLYTTYQAVVTLHRLGASITEPERLDSDCCKSVPGRSPDSRRSYR